MERDEEEGSERSGLVTPPEGERLQPGVYRVTAYQVANILPAEGHTFVSYFCQHAGEVKRLHVREKDAKSAEAESGYEPPAKKVKQEVQRKRLGEVVGKGEASRSKPGDMTNYGECPPDNVPGDCPDDLTREVTNSATNRVIRKSTAAGDIYAVYGRDYCDDIDEPTSLVGALVMPSQQAPNIYTNSAANVESGIQGRIIDKCRPCTLNRSQKRKLEKFVNVAMGVTRQEGKVTVEHFNKSLSLFSKERIQAWCSEKFHLEELVSRKWALDRIEDSINEAFQTAFPEFKFSTRVKLEQMPNEKLPRILIADKDSGQLFALVVVKCFEDLLFEWFKTKSIKHCSKKDAMKRVVRQLTPPKGKSMRAMLIEGDGSAWDTTCNAVIREIIENRILAHIAEIVCEYGVVPEQWHKAHLAANSQHQLRLFYKKRHDELRASVAAIRRSGHRGTSCLNWWINFTMWTVSLFREPWLFLNPSRRYGTDIEGVNRWWNGSFEGDDSIAATSPKFDAGSTIDIEFRAFWYKAGFDMKLIFPGAVGGPRNATFTGWHFATVDQFFTGESTPELPRALAGGTSTSGHTLQSVNSGDASALMTTAGHAALARASDFAGILPTVSRKYAQYAADCFARAGPADPTVVTWEERELSFRVGAEGEKVIAADLFDSIEEQNAMVTMKEEIDRCNVFGYDVDLDGMIKFQGYTWDWDRLDDHDGFRESLPVAWRK